MIKNLFVKVSILGALALVLAACGGASEPAVSTLPQGNQAVESQPSLVVPDPTQPTQAATDLSQPALEVSELPTATTKSKEGIPLGFTLGAPGLRATNPSRVNFAKGEPQVIEYFAFW